MLAINMIEYFTIFIMGIILQVTFNYISRKTRKVYAFLIFLIFLIAINIQHPTRIEDFNNYANPILLLISGALGLYTGDKIYPEKIKKVK
jgi:cytosine/uracil/thiamine/allantoin permease